MITSAAYQAMVFARAVHKNQRRKYTGDIRKTDIQLINAMATLYRSGLQVSWISECVGIPTSSIRNYIANYGLQRDPALFAQGVDCFKGDGESFKRIPWAPWYFISDLGRIVGMSPTRPGTVIRPAVLPNGYLTAKLVEQNRVAKHNYIHRVVLSVFSGESPKGMQCAHCDGVKTNNRLSNLRWATFTENASDKAAHGTLLLGDEHPISKINSRIAADIKVLLHLGQKQCDVARQLAVHISCVANIAQNKTWKHVEINK